MKYLTNLGVAGDRVSTITYGEEKPADPGHNEAAWAKNRRGVFVSAKRNAAPGGPPAPRVNSFPASSHGCAVPAVASGRPERGVGHQAGGLLGLREGDHLPQGFAPARIIARRSSPNAIPREEALRTPALPGGTRTSCRPPPARCSAVRTSDCTSRRWIRMLPPPISAPFSTMSYAFARTFPGSVSSRGRSSSRGAVKGWCIAAYRPASLSHSSRGNRSPRGSVAGPVDESAFSPRCSPRRARERIRRELVRHDQDEIAGLRTALGEKRLHLVAPEMLRDRRREARPDTFHQESPAHLRSSPPLPERPVRSCWPPRIPVR